MEQLLVSGRLGSLLQRGHHPQRPSLDQPGGATSRDLQPVQRYRQPFHWWEPPRELLESMPRKRRSLFRHAYGEEANKGLETRNLFARALG